MKTLHTPWGPVENVPEHLDFDTLKWIEKLLSEDRSVEAFRAAINVTIHDSLQTDIKWQKERIVDLDYQRKDAYAKYKDGKISLMDWLEKSKSIDQSISQAESSITGYEGELHNYYEDYY